MYAWEPINNELNDDSRKMTSSAVKSDLVPLGLEENGSVFERCDVGRECDLRMVPRLSACESSDA